MVVTQSVSPVEQVCCDIATALGMGSVISEDRPLRFRGRSSSLTVPVDFNVKGCGQSNKLESANWCSKSKPFRLTSNEII